MHFYEEGFGKQERKLKYSTFHNKVITITAHRVVIGATVTSHALSATTDGLFVAVVVAGLSASINVVGKLALISIKKKHKVCLQKLHFGKKGWKSSQNFFQSTLKMIKMEERIVQIIIALSEAKAGLFKSARRPFLILTVF